MAKPNQVSNDELRKMLIDLKKITTDSSNEVKESIRSLREELRDEINDLKANVSQIKEREAKLELEVIRLGEEVRNLREEREVDQQYNRKNNMIIYGVPNRKQERTSDLLNTVADLANKLDIELEPYHIDTLHRLPTKRAGASSNPIIVKLNSRITKKEFIIRSRRRRIEGIFIDDQLTQYTQALFTAAREKKKASEIEKVWIREGTVFAISNEGDAPVKINNLETLIKMPRKSNRKAIGETTNKAEEEVGEERDAQNDNHRDNEGRVKRKIVSPAGMQSPKNYKRAGDIRSYTQSASINE